MEVQDVTDTANRSNILRAERKGRLALVLSKLSRPVVRADGKRVSYQIEECVLSKGGDNELACVAVNEFNYYSAKELSPFLKNKKNLFSFLTVS